MGTLEAGKLASFVVLDEDPIAELRNLGSSWCTVKRGTPYARADFTEGDR
jgi:imidazolonepropionase-like amidohydrolase